jgi:hypothetical protein
MPEVQKIQWRRGTAAAWTAANPVLSEGTPGFESDTGRFKVGDGVKNWKTLAYQGEVTLAGTQVLTHKTLGAGTVYQNPAGSVAFKLGGTASAPGHLLFTTGIEGGNVSIRSDGVTNCDVVLVPSGGVPGQPLKPGGRVIVNATGAGHDAILLANGDDTNVDWNLVPKGLSSVVKANSVPVVTTTGTQALSNKTVRGSVNTVLLDGVVPASKTAAGLPGQVAVAAGFVYVCVAANQWQRAPLADW